LVFGQRWLPERDGAGGYIYVKNLIDLTYVLRVVFRLTTSSWKHVRPLVESWSWLAPPQHTRDVCLAAASHRFSSENPSPWIWIDRDRVRASVPLQLHVSLHRDASGAGLPASPHCPPRKKHLLGNAGSLLRYCGLEQTALLSPAGDQRCPAKTCKGPQRTTW